MPEHWDALGRLDGSVDAQVQVTLFLELRRLAERGVLWLLRHRRPPLAIGPTVAAFRDGATLLADELPTLASGAHAVAMAEAAGRARAAGLPADLASRASAWPYLHTSFDIIEVANARGRSPADAARVYWGLFERLDLEWLWDRIGRLPRTDRWQSHARAGLRDDSLEEMRKLADDALRAGDVFTSPEALVEHWAMANARRRGSSPSRVRRDPSKWCLRCDDVVGGAPAAAQLGAVEQPRALRARATVRAWPW